MTAARLNKSLLTCRSIRTLVEGHMARHLLPEIGCHLAIAVATSPKNFQSMNYPLLMASPQCAF
jgi:hypothetical protein